MPTRANGQLAVGCYIHDPDHDCYRVAVLDVLTLRGEFVHAVTAFLAPWLFGRFGEGVDDVMTPALFARFGLAETLPA